MASWRPWYRVTVTDCDGVEFAWLVGGAERPDLQAVDVLGRLALLTRRGGASIALTEVSPAIGELLELTGMTAEVRCQDPPDDAFRHSHR